MIELLDSPDHVVAYRIAGTLDAEDYDRVIATVEAKLSEHPEIGLYADMTGFTDMTGAALVKDFRYSLEKLSEWGRFPRAALVTDKRWMQALVEVLDPVFPQFEARAFAPGHESEAMAWASDLPAVRS